MPVTGSPGVYGFEEFNARILNLIRALPDEIANALILEETGTLALAVSRTPVKTGALKISGELGAVEKKGWEYSIPITFGAELQYAIYVHENLEARHYPPYGTGGQAKFLESAVLDRIPGKLERIRDSIILART